MTPWQLNLAVTADGLFEMPADGETEPDVTVTLPAGSPFEAIGGIDRVMANAHVTGNAEFATELSFVLRNLRWDAEEDLSRVFGDIVAHRLVSTANQLAAWHRRGVEGLSNNVAEYLAEEAHVLTPSRELAALRQDIEEFTARVAALEARIKRIS